MNLIQSKFSISGALESLVDGRAENQDFMGYADTQLGFVLVLCDGMGGGPAGLTASTTVVDAVIHHLGTYTKDDDVKMAISKSIAFADEQISNQIAKSPEFTGMENLHTSHISAIVVSTNSVLDIKYFAPQIILRLVNLFDMENSPKNKHGHPPIPT